MPSSSGATHKIGWAIQQAKAGRAVTRQGWRPRGQKVTLHNTMSSGMSYLRLTTRSGKFWPMTFTQRDLLAEDYVLAE